MNLPCTFKLKEHGPSSIEGTVIAFVPAANPLEYYPCTGDPTLRTHYTVDALIVLRTFDIGAIYQIPMHRVKLTQEVAKHLYGGPNHWLEA